MGNGWGKPIERLPPPGPGRLAKHRKIFDLCRRLKAIPAMASAEPSALRPIVQEWHRQALPAIGTKPFVDTWADFLNGWNKVKWAAGQGPIDEAFRQAMKRKPPKAAVELYGYDPIIRLASLCRELQRGVSDGEFIRLDCRTAGRLLGVSHKTAWKWLTVLVADCILIAGEKGSRAAHKASEFVYVEALKR